MDRQTSLSGMVTFVCLICVYTIKEYKTAFHARRINVKDEIFISEWDKENARIYFSDKDLSEIRNAMTEDIFNTDKTSRSGLCYTKLRCLIFAFRAANAVLVYSIQTGRNLPNVRDLKNVRCLSCLITLSTG